MNTVELEIKAIDVKAGLNARIMEKGDLDGLKTSIQRKGILTPLIVKPAGDRYMLVAGERRYRAALDLGLVKVPATIREEDDELEVTAIENIQREQLTPLEEARAYQAMIDGGYTAEGVAEAASVRIDVVQNRLSLLGLPEQMHDMVDEGQFGLRDAAGTAAVLDKIPGLRKKVDAALKHKKTGERAQRDFAHNPGWWLAQMCDGLKGVYSASTVHLADVPAAVKKPLEAELGELDKAYQASWHSYGGRAVTEVRIPDAVRERAEQLGSMVTIGRHDLVLDPDYEFLKQELPGIVKAATATYKKEKGGSYSGGTGQSKTDAEKAKAKKEREEAKANAIEARAINLKFGEHLVTKLGKVSLTVDVARFLALAALRGHNLYGGDSVTEQVSALAGRGLAMVLPEFGQSSTELKSGAVRYHYLGDKITTDREELDKRFWKWFDEAKTAEEILGKLFTAYAAAEFALNDAKDTQAKRVYWSWHAARHDKAAAALAKIAAPALTPALKAYRKKHKIGT